MRASEHLIFKRKNLTFELKQKEHLAQGVKRLATLNINRALSLIKKKEDTDVMVHEVRKRLKELRGLIRLVRDDIGEKKYKKLNVKMRDAGRLISHLRDAKAYLETMQLLKEKYSDSLSKKPFDGVEKLLQTELDNLRKLVIDQNESHLNIKETLEKIKPKVEQWPVGTHEFMTIAPGLSRVYGRGHKAMDKAFNSDEEEVWHLWRKRVKYLRYHTELLKMIWPPMMSQQLARLNELSDILGLEHDMATFSTQLKNMEEELPEEELHLLNALVVEERVQYQKLAITLGKRLYAEDVNSFVQRMNGYWDATFEE